MKVTEQWLKDNGYSLSGKKISPADVSSSPREIKSQKNNKYGAVESGGYASIHEHKRADELKLMEKAGLISELREQVVFELVPSQRGMDGKVKERPVKYIADFVYIDQNGRQVVEDAKGKATKDYVIKRKLMRFLLGIEVVEV